MALFDFAWLRKRGDGADFVPGQRQRYAPTQSIEHMRTRARHRLIGAAVLVVLGVVGFGLLFESQPRPVAADAPAPIPERDSAAPLVIATAPAATEVATEPDAVGQEKPADALVDKPTPKLAEKPVDKSIDKPADKTAEKIAEKPVEKPTAKPVEKVAEKTTDKSTDKPTKLADKPKPAEKPAAVAAQKPQADERAFEQIVAAANSRTAASTEAARARALLEGRSPSSSASAAAAPSQRFIVQVGAFADTAKVDEVRTKLRAQGIATFTQTVQTRDGARVRVRVGPFNSRSEADAAAARVGAAGFGASVMPQ